MKEYMFSKKGTIIKCPYCGIDLYRINKDITTSTSIMAKLFTPIGKQPVMIDDMWIPVYSRCGCQDNYFSIWYHVNQIEYSKERLKRLYGNGE